jgi:hypothetical protein
MSAHPFVPGSSLGVGRTTCAVTGCFLTPDQHMGALAAELQVNAPRQRNFKRNRRVVRNLPLCATDGCPWAPMRDRKWCRKCYAAMRPLRLGLREEMQLFNFYLSKSQHAAMLARAKAEGLTAAAWLRKRIVEATGQTRPTRPADSSSSTETSGARSPA